MRGRGPPRCSAPRRIHADEREHDTGPERADRFDQVVDALVAPRRPEKHDDLAVAHGEARARGGAIVPAWIPGVRIAHVRQERSTEPALEEPRSHRDRVGARDELLGQPGPRQPIRIGEVEGATDAPPHARAREEADLPVVDVEHQRSPAPGSGQEPQAEARRARLGRDENIAVNEVEQGGNAPREPGIATDRHAALRDRAVPRGHPDLGAEARPDHLDLVARRQKTGEQIRAACRVVRQVGGKDGDLHAAPAVTRLA